MVRVITLVLVLGRSIKNRYIMLQVLVYEKVIDSTLQFMWRAVELGALSCALSCYKSSVCF